jgi:hypothetical protein
MMTTQQVADRLVWLIREGKNLQAIDELYANDVISKEPKGHPHELTSGIGKVRKNVEVFEANVLEMHAITASDPLVEGNYFAFTLEIDATYRNHGRSRMRELCLYKARDGKVITDEFFYDLN